MNKRRALSLVTGDFLLIIGAGAIAVGIMFILKPDGSNLGMTVDLLKESPFSDFFIPGLFLMAANGILSIIAALLLFINYRYAGISVMVLGVVMFIWISAQVYWIGWESWLQPAFLAVGLVELLIGFFLEAPFHDKWGRFGSHRDSHAH
ncbi:hypothetical protein [Neobacillus drentensis]|uniref:hypothetical protein n=1 Tax=Neobacillus drentensis TaxID=220684 RepID=UPI003000EC82